MIKQRLPDFVGVAASGTATLKIPKWALTLGRILLTLGGTTFTKAMIADIKVKLGSRTIWNVQTQGATAGGTHLDRINTYKGMFSQANQIVIDFTEQMFENIVAKEIGAWDMSKWPDDVFLEVTIAGATAPTLRATAFYAPPQGGKDANNAIDPNGQLVQKLIPVPWAAAAAGRYTLPFEPRGAIIKRVYVMFNGSTGTATTQGNINESEVKKNGQTIWNEVDTNVKFIEQDYDRVIQAQMHVIDHCFDNNLSSAVTTADAASLEYILNLTASDNGVAYFEVLDLPYNL